MCMLVCVVSYLKGSLREEYSSSRTKSRSLSNTFLRTSVPVSLTSQSISIHDLVQNLYLDITSQLSFAQSFNIIKDGKPDQGAQDIDTYFNIAPLFGIFPIAKYLPFGIFGAAKQAPPRIVRAVQSDIDNFQTRLRSGVAQSGLLRLMVEAKDDVEPTTGSKVAFSDAELNENAVIFMLAGSGTTGSTLLYLIYEVGKRPEMQRKLHKQIRIAFPGQHAVLDYDRARQLPYLNSLVHETLRLRAPIPTVAPRVSPGKRIDSDFVPAGVIVSNLPYSTHRDCTVFEHPEEFVPGRWSSDRVTPEMTVMHKPLSSGPRNCLGLHLARVQLLLTVCTSYSRFDIELDCVRTTDEKMVMREQGLMTPIDEEVWVRVEALTTE